MDATVVANRSTKGLSGARNTGVAASSGDVDRVPRRRRLRGPTWLERLCAPLEDPHVAGVGGWIVPEWQGRAAPWFPTTYYWILGCSYAGLPETGATLRNPIGASMAIRRSVFDLVGGFTSGIGRIGKVPLGCEETELCIRYGAQRPGDRFVLERDAIVHHLVPAVAAHVALLPHEVLGRGSLQGRRLLPRRRGLGPRVGAHARDAGAAPRVRRHACATCRVIQRTAATKLGAHRARHRDRGRRSRPWPPLASHGRRSIRAATTSPRS